MIGTAAHTHTHSVIHTLTCMFLSLSLSKGISTRDNQQINNRLINKSLTTLESKKLLSSCTVPRLSVRPWSGPRWLRPVCRGWTVVCGVDRGRDSASVGVGGCLYRSGQNSTSPSAPDPSPKCSFVLSVAWSASVWWILKF